MASEPARFGNQGRLVRMSTNMFRISKVPKRTFYHYHEITLTHDDGTTKEIQTPMRMREIVDKMQQDNRQIFTKSPAYDGKKNLYTTVEIRQTDFTVRMSRNPNSNRGIFQVRLRRVNTIQPRDLEMLTTPDGLNNPAAVAVATNLLQVIVSQTPNLKHHFALHSKSFYMQSNMAAKLSGGLEAWRGFFQSVRPVLNKIVINVDTTTAAIYAPGSLFSHAMAYLRHRDARAFVQECESNTSAIRKLRNFYKNVAVKVPGKNREAKIDDIVPCAGKETFNKGNEILSVEEHFMSHYRIKLKYPTSFGVRIGKVAIYPAEVCEVMPGQVYKKKLDGSDTTIMLKISTVRPDKRLREIRQAVADDDVLGYKSSPFILDADMAIDAEPIQAPGRVIAPPKVLYGGNRTVGVRSGAWNVKNMRFRDPAKIKVWAVVNFDTSPGSGTRVTAFAQNLHRNMKDLGIQFLRDVPVIRTGNQVKPHESLMEAAKEASGQLPEKPKPGLILVVLPQNAGPLRKAVKQWGDMITGIPTQCVREGKYGNANDQYCNNVALKINAKTGGVNSIADSSEAGTAFLKTCMVVGCDVAHPSPGAKGRPSIASLVASVDEYATRYHSELSVQAPRQETIDSIGNMMKTAVNTFQKRRKQFPSHIIVYRDGVSEGEYAQLEDGEIKDIQDQLDDLHRHTGVKPKLIFIVVGKRHHVRFFPDKADEDNTGNAPSGLVVDREIVHSRYTDFYLQSQGGLKGTSRPSHYVVLRNESGLTADQLQELSFALCHVYASATRSVSIPAPVYYADRLCARADFHFKPGLNYSDDGASSAEADKFDLAAWEAGLGQSLLRHEMHFL